MNVFSSRMLFIYAIARDSLDSHVNDCIILEFTQTHYDTIVFYYANINVYIQLTDYIDF